MSQVKRVPTICAKSRKMVKNMQQSNPEPFVASAAKEEEIVK
jgi:hypothetical protein